MKINCMAFLNRIILLFFSILIFGCGEEKINTSIDSNSVERIVANMSPEEGLKFLADAELISQLRGSPHAINGYTVTQVREEAAIGRRYVAEKNREFLAPLLRTLLLSGSDSARFMQNSVGIYTSPQPGYRSKSYSLAEIRSFYQSNGGDFAELEASVQSALEAERASQASLATSVESSEPTCSIRLDDADAKRVWVEMTTTKASYLANCRVFEAERQVRLGGLSPDQALEQAKQSCETLVAEAFKCMAKPGSVAADCICAVDD